MTADPKVEMRAAVVEKDKNGPTLLLVDDDLAILEGVADLLELHGYNIITATDGVEALEAMHEKAPDLVISDIMMREMDGYEFYEAVRKNPAWTMLPFIFLTARGQTIDIRRGHSLGADAYLTKPFEPEDLLIAIRARLKRMDEIRDVTRADVDQVKQQLMTIFSHELRTPLAYIYGYVNLLDEHFSDTADETIDTMIDGAKQGAERLVSLVDDLMLMVRIDSGVVGMEIERRRLWVDLVPLIEKVADNARFQVKGQNKALATLLPDELTVSCIPVYVEDMIERLVDNALKFLKGGGGQVLVSAGLQDDRVIVAVEDDGIGIAPGLHETIFERFRQIDRETMEQQGTGLGLSIARSLARLHGGDITMRSEVGKGSMFVISLPVQEIPLVAGQANGNKNHVLEEML
jgi:two-component system sensor histidine kinase/response regulator